MPWFTFHQNNSGGRFFGPEKVVIEAYDAPHANSRAENEAGIYFDGVSRGIDCGCCGDRWSRRYDYHGTPTPQVYSEPAADVAGAFILPLKANQ